MRLPEFLPAGGSEPGRWSPAVVDGLVAPAGDSRCHQACAAGFGHAKARCSGAFNSWECMAAIDAGLGICNSIC